MSDDDEFSSSYTKYELERTLEALVQEAVKTGQKGLLGEIDEGQRFGLRDEFSENVYADLTMLKTRIHNVKLDSQGPWYSPYYAFDRARYYAGFATLTNSSTLQYDMKDVQTRLSKTTVRRERCRTLYSLAYYERFPDNESTSLAATWRTPPSKEYFKWQDKMLIEMSKHVVEIIESFEPPAEYKATLAYKQIAREIAKMLELTIRTCRKYTPQPITIRSLITRGNGFIAYMQKHQADHPFVWSNREVKRLQGMLVRWNLDLQTLGDILASLHRKTEIIRSTNNTLSVDVSANIGDVLIEEIQLWDARIDELVGCGKMSRSESLIHDRSDLLQNLSDHFTYESVSKQIELIFNVKILFKGPPSAENVGKIDRTPQSGGYGDVISVRLNEPLEVASKQGQVMKVDTVAVKLAKVMSESRTCLRIVRECRAWSQMNHENIVPLLGLWIGFSSIHDSHFLAFVSPWMEDGNLLAYIQKHPETTTTQRLIFLMDVAKALDFMHTRNRQIVHGDLKSNNVLVRDGRAFVCDFGLSYIADNLKGLTTEGKGPWRWTSPELLNSDGKPTTESDMYAFGCVFLEVFTGDVPWAEETNNGSRLANPVAIPRRPECHTDNLHWEFMKKCWKALPTLRPTAKKAWLELEKYVLREKLKDMLRESPSLNSKTLRYLISDSFEPK